MANIKQIIPCEPGWEGVFVREDATYDAPVKTQAAPLVGWALIDDETGESSVHALVNLGPAVTTSYDLSPRWLGAVRAGDWAERLNDHWDAAAVAYMEEYGEPGTAGEEGEAEGEASEEGAPEGGAAEEAKAG